MQSAKNATNIVYYTKAIKSRIYIKTMLGEIIILFYSNPTKTKENVSLKSDC